MSDERDDDLAANLLASLKRVEPPDDTPLGTCDWGDCDEDAVAYRESFVHGWLPVCEAHRGREEKTR